MTSDLRTASLRLAQAREALNGNAHDECAKKMRAAAAALEAAFRAVQETIDDADLCAIVDKAIQQCAEVRTKASGLGVMVAPAWTLMAIVGMEQLIDGFDRAASLLAN